MAKTTADGFSKKFFSTEARDDRWVKAAKGDLGSWGQELIERYSAYPKMNARDRKVFVREFLTEKTVGSPLLSALLSLLVPIFLRLLESWLSKEGV